MRSEFKDGKLYLYRDDEERGPLVQRLSRIEGQVRGLQQMIQQDRYCGDELQQATAILAAMREVMRLLMTQHINAGLARLSDGSTKKEQIAEDFELVMRSIMRDQ